MRCFLAFVACLIVLSSSPAQAEKKVALVIGNDRYANLAILQKAVNDAEAVGDTLARLGFEVIRGRDLGRQGMIDKLSEFTARLEAGDTALFFFAGHGVAIGGVNYLVPTDVPRATVGAEARVRGASIAEADIIAEIQGKGARVAVLVLDACRDNPFPRAGTRTLGNTRGLADARPARGVFTLYSAGIGQTALDRLERNDANPNSVFTRVLLDHLAKPGLHIGELAIEVREEVAKVALGAKNDKGEPDPHEQTPAYYDQTIGGRVFLAGRAVGVEPPPRPSATLPPTPSEAERAWLTIKDTTNVAVLEAFIRRFGDSFYADLARARLEELKKTAVVAPPIAPSTPPAPTQPAVGVFPSPIEATPLSPERERALKPKDSFKECDACPEMVVVPAGSFTMGSPTSEKERASDEGPQRRVTLPRQFAVGKFEVTVDEFMTFVKETGHDAGFKCRGYLGGMSQERSGMSWRNPGFSQSGSHPAACLSWNDAKAYVAWLSRRIGKPYRLLSEAEWEYVARVGTTTRYHFGEDENALCGHGNKADQKAKRTVPEASGWPVGTCDDGHAYTAPVGSLAPNAFGLHDMYGNVWEWVEDCWNNNYRGAPTDGSAWVTGDCSRRVLRGGSWVNYLSSAFRSAGRFRNPADMRTYTLGFRIGRTLVTP